MNDTYEGENLEGICILSFLYMPHPSHRMEASIMRCQRKLEGRRQDGTKMAEHVLG